MKTLALVWRELIGLFVDDRSFALVLLAIVALAAAVGYFPAGKSDRRGCLVFGLLGRAGGKRPTDKAERLALRCFWRDGVHPRLDAAPVLRRSKSR